MNRSKSCLQNANEKYGVQHAQYGGLETLFVSETFEADVWGCMRMNPRQNSNLLLLNPNLHFKHSILQSKHAIIKFKHSIGQFKS